MSKCPPDIVCTTLIALLGNSVLGPNSVYSVVQNNLFYSTPTSFWFCDRRIYKKDPNLLLDLLSSRKVHWEEIAFLTRPFIISHHLLTTVKRLLHCLLLFSSLKQQKSNFNPFPTVVSPLPLRQLVFSSALVGCPALWHIGGADARTEHASLAHSYGSEGPLLSLLVWACAQANSLAGTCSRADFFILWLIHKRRNQRPESLSFNPQAFERCLGAPPVRFPFGQLSLFIYACTWKYVHMYNETCHHIACSVMSVIFIYWFQCCLTWT